MQVTELGIYDVDRTLVSRHVVGEDGALLPPASVPDGGLVLLAFSGGGRYFIPAQACVLDRVKLGEVRANPPALCSLF